MQAALDCCLGARCHQSRRRLSAPTSLHLRGGSQEHRGNCYYDVDGTLYHGTMGHCAWWFVGALPHPRQRAIKRFQICLTIPFIGILALFDEAKAARLLAGIILRGVTQQDASLASKIVASGIMSRAYPQVLEHLRAQQGAGRKVFLLSGNVEPMIESLAHDLGCSVIATRMEIKNGRYTGNVLGDVCVLERKRQKLLEHLPSNLKGSGLTLRGTTGVGNSMYDVPFLEEVSEAYVVRPGSRLRKIAERRGWKLDFARVKGVGAEDGKKKSGSFRSFFSRYSFELGVSIFWGAACGLLGITATPSASTAVGVNTVKQQTETN
ncbi:hypothetical protein GUITHDRAFT_99051 [Guillardia theta CCMP2712]|uniref:Phosphoserine phosphatase n=1 Tax=Guillardia theta (strain CCMP2712) TaxID=905079 RepID=L1K499_GUITC|nr:hypothetical protein GUITHDRAFT_99051 [Guillardia theta CCMP2712]EKX55270.1 hypothetical protein GUITHDRAFT_99051 [Guillardia theta CCMP2712]|eukprot:XP_005842250.1 hypothetical protein GUITHDRAFT_99051 [Guillardia theta CCMP2712]